MKPPMRVGSLLLLLLVACERPVARSPEERAYRAFAEAVRSGDSATAWAGLSRGTQDLMKAKSREIAQASQGVVKDEPALLMFQSGIRPAATGEVKVLESDGGTAVIEVTTSGQPHHIVMVREADRWVVDLSGIF